MPKVNFAVKQHKEEHTIRPEQEKAMAELKQALGNVVPLGNIDYDSGGAIVLLWILLVGLWAFTFTKRVQMRRESRLLLNLGQLL